MTSTLTRIALGLICLATVGACPRPDLRTARRGPSSADGQSECRELTPRQLEIFRRVALSNDGITRSMADLARLAHLLQDDSEALSTQHVSISDFFGPDQNIQFDRVEAFSQILLGDCALLRSGDNPNGRLTREKQPNEFRKAQELCGQADGKIAASDRRHPTLTRDEWSNFDGDARTDLRGWITSANGLYDSQTGKTLAPDKAVALCSAFKSRSNVEDSIENLFLCLDAFMLSLSDYDDAKEAYATDARGGLKKVSKAELEEVHSCLENYRLGKVALAADGTPVSPKRPTGASGASSASGASGASAASGASGASGTSGASGASAASGASGASAASGSSGATTPHYGGKPNLPSKPKPTLSRCLPADQGDGQCKADACIQSLANKRWSRQLWLPPELSSHDLKLDYDDERGRYVYELSKEQARVLGQAFVVAAYQRRWDTPKGFNENLREFTGSCGDPKLRTELESMAGLEYLDEELRDSSYDPRFADQRDTADDKGRRMVNAVNQILALRKLVSILNYELGAREVKTWRVPRWAGYVPVGRAVTKAVAVGTFRKRDDFEIPYVSDFELPVPFMHFLIEQPIGIDFGKVGDYQCNLFATMMADDLVPRTPALLRPSDSAVLRLFNDTAFRKTAFCARDGACHIPDAFQTYLTNTDHAGFLADAPQIHLRDWCSQRWEAAQSLIGLEQAIITSYPALGHSDLVKGKNGHDDTPGAPLFDRIAALHGTDEEKAKYAADEADRVLPGIQSDLRRYLARVCSDLSSGKPESSYMALLNRHFLAGFDYCASLAPAEASRLGLSCGVRAGFLGCELQREADRWLRKKETPEFLYQVGMAELDGLAVMSAVSGGVTGAFTVRGMITGGLTGLGFTGLNYGVSYLIAQNNQAQWNDYSRGVAGAALEGVDSYANALTSLAASKPRLKLQDFLTGFVMGAAFGGKDKEGVARKVTELAESDAAGGVRFSAESVSKLKDWMIEKSSENPALASELIRNLGDGLGRLSDSDYSSLFDSTDGKVALSKVRRALGIRLRQVVARLGAKLGRIGSEVRFKRLSGGALSDAETLIDRTTMSAADLAKTAEALGPRELSELADAADAAADDVPGEKAAARNRRLADFLRKLCITATACPALSGLEGCPL